MMRDLLPIAKPLKFMGFVVNVPKRGEFLPIKVSVFQIV
jgi:hypothetical protein